MQHKKSVKCNEKAIRKMFQGLREVISTLNVLKHLSGLGGTFYMLVIITETHKFA